jgi:hypothetical protein
MRRFLKDQHGEIGGSILFLFAFLIVLSVTYTYGRALVVRNQVSAELSRALNTAIQLSMQDEYRRDSISQINTVRAEAEVYEYLKGTGLDENMITRRDGLPVFRLSIFSLTFTESPPSARITGTVYVPVGMLQALGVPAEMQFSFSVASRNQRMD